MTRKPCPFCRRWFYTLGDLRGHMKSAHGWFAPATETPPAVRRKRGCWKCGEIAQLHPVRLVGTDNIVEVCRLCRAHLDSVAMIAASRPAPAA